MDLDLMAHWGVECHTIRIGDLDGVASFSLFDSGDTVLHDLGFFMTSWGRREEKRPEEIDLASYRAID